MGTASLALRRYDLARKSYETAIALDPDYVLALVNLGLHYLLRSISTKPLHIIKPA